MDYNQQLIEHFSSLQIPENRIIVIHARLKNIKNNLDLSYESSARLILEWFYNFYRPKTVLVPSFTYSFTRSGIFHRVFSRSEVGRFSEEIRKLYGQHRTLDPIFSFVDTNKYLDQYNLNYCTAFDEGGIFDFLDKEDCIIVNIDLDQITQTQIHYIEKINRVDYRYDKLFEGVVYSDQHHWKSIKYRYFVRDLKLNPRMDYKKRERYLIERGALNVFSRNGLVISWISARKLNEVISQALASDPYFLIINGDIKG